MNPEKNKNNNNVEPAPPAKIRNVTAGLDIGTTKICCIVAEHDEKPGSIKILGIGITESKGLNRGVVVNIDKTVKAIQGAVEQAEQQSGLKITEVVAGIAGDHIESIASRGIVGISQNETREISESDVIRSLEDSKKIAIPAERQILHVIPQDYIIDGQDGITDPVGMCGVRMEANVHIVTGLATAIQNIYRCCEKANLKVAELVLEPLASCESVLTEDEKEVGVALIDIGGGTTDIAIFKEGIIRFTSVFAIAGRQITDDIRQGIGIIAKEAERIKHQYGHAHQGAIMKDEVFMIPGIAGRKPIELTKSFLCQVIQPRFEEIMEFALAEINRSGFSTALGAGAVITGGSSLLKGSEELAAHMLGMPVKLGIPSGLTISGLAPEIESPVYSTAVGLALYALKKQGEKPKIIDDKTDPVKAVENIKPGKTAKKKKEKSSKGSILKKIKNFMEEL